MRCSKCREQDLAVKTVDRQLHDVLGVPVLVHGLPLLVCPKCKAETMIGSVIDKVSMLLVALLLETGAPLRNAEIKFLRGALGFTQDELAKHLGVSRIAIARWETRDDLLDGPQARALRSLVYFRLRDELPELAAVAESFAQPPRPERKSRRYEIDAPRLSSPPL
jgi:DNA-binding transcriptional regulator YiaG